MVEPTSSLGVMGGPNYRTPRAAIQRELDGLRGEITTWFIDERLTSDQMLEKLIEYGLKLTHGQLHVAIKRFSLLRPPKRRPKGIKNVYPDRICAHCKESYTPNSSGQMYCRNCAPANDGMWWRRIRNFGIGKREFDVMFAKQEGKCGICREPLDLEPSNKSQTRTVIDHDHVTGKVRSLTHHWYNIRLVESIEYHERCAEYLRSHGAHETHKVRRPS